MVDFGYLGPSTCNVAVAHTFPSVYQFSFDLLNGHYCKSLSRLTTYPDILNAIFYSLNAYVPTLRTYSLDTPLCLLE